MNSKSLMLVRSSLAALTIASATPTLAQDVGPGSLVLADAAPGSDEEDDPQDGSQARTRNSSSASQLSGAEQDTITVTGTRPGAERRSSSPMSITTAEDIERKQVTNMTDLLRGEIPGLFVVNAGSNDWTTRVYTRGTTSWNYDGSDLYNDYAKIFIDGVELARPTLLSMIDPNTIEQIEMVRGPQAGTIYGTDGSNGLMKIVTKKGSSGRKGTELIAQISGGIMESDRTPEGVTPWVQHHSLQLFGGDDDFGFSLGGSYQSTGEWAPGIDSKAYALTGGLRARRGDFTLSLSGFHNHRDYRPFAGTNYPMTETLVAATLGYQASPNWQHTLTIGQDINAFGYHGLDKTRGNSFYNTDYARRTLRYLTTYDARLSPDFSAVFMAGGDAVFYDADTIRASGVRFVDGKLDLTTATSTEAEKQYWRNFGYFGMAEFGFRDQLYLTLAARVEEGLRHVSNSEKRHFQPRVGLSYVLDKGPMSLKLRGQWGRSVRAPVTDILAGSRTNAVVFRPPNLRPEVKEGWDAGFDLAWNGIGSLSVTYFNEEGRDLIMPVSINEAVRPRIREHQNFGIVTNKGWEFEGNATFGPLSVRGNLILTDNRIKKISSLAGTGQNSVGSRMENVPEYSGGITATLRLFDGSVSANTSFLGPRIIRFAGEAAPLWRFNLRAEQPIAQGFTIFGRVDNVTNNQTSDAYDFAFAPGRTWVLGLRKSLGIGSGSSSGRGPIFGRAAGIPRDAGSPSAPSTAAGGTGQLHGTHDSISDAIIVTAPYQRDRIDVLSGTSALSGAELTRQLRPTIGETLARQPGVSATSFGPNASRPILRGFQGERIRVLTDGVGSIDVSNTSVDHAAAINPLTAERIEVLRGPAALLFGSSAIGGVVNVIDNRIPRTVPAEQAHLDTIVGYGSAADETAISAVLNMPLSNNIVLHADGSYLKTGDLRTGGYLYARDVREHAAEHAAEQNEPELLVEANARGRLPNTASETSEFAGGLSYIGDRGSIGFVVSRYDSLYGVPARFDLHGEDEPGGGHSHGGHAHSGVRLDAAQTRIDVRGELLTGGGFIDRVRLRAAHADYRHDEIEAEGAIGTSFFNKGSEGRLELAQRERDGWSGAIGGQFFDRNFRVVGEEKFLPRSSTRQYGLFTLQSFDLGALRAEAGARLEHSDISAKADADLGIGNIDRSFNAFSFSAGASYAVAEGVRLGLNASRAERAPSPEELFANGPHIGTQAFEIGNPAFGKESSWGLEATLKGRGAGFDFAASIYHNWFSNYIFDYQTGARIDGLPVFQYAQADARYFGIEGEVSARLATIGDFEIRGDLLGDYVRATVEGAGPAPRIPSLRLLGGVEAKSARLGGRIEIERAFKQERVSAYETSTDGYTIVNMSASWTPFNGNATSFLLSVNNLFDVEARRHSSVLKDYAPLAGRDVRLTARIQF